MSMVTGTVVVPSWATVATRPTSRTVPAVSVPSGSSIVTAWPGATRSCRLADRSRVTTRPAVVVSSTGVPGPTDVPTSAATSATRTAPGRNARSLPSRVPSRRSPVAFCQFFTARVVQRSQSRSTSIFLGA